MRTFTCRSTFLYGVEPLANIQKKCSLIVQSDRSIYKNDVPSYDKKEWRGGLPKPNTFPNLKYS